MDPWENNETMNHYNWGSNVKDDNNDDSWNMLSYDNSPNTYNNDTSERHMKDILGLINDEPDDDSSYVPSESEDSESISDESCESCESEKTNKQGGDDDNASTSSSSETNNDNQNTYEDDEEWLQIYDEKRQDTDGGWYTRRQFYDYYGSDEAWDNLDPDIYHQYRYDSLYGEWHCKEEFYQHYGTNDVWKKMNPKRYMKRRALCDTYHWASYLPDRLQDGFIKRMLQTYDFYV